MSWVGGVFWFAERTAGSIDFTFQAPIQFRGHSTIDTDAWALFGQARYRLSKRLGVTGGLRYSQERDEGHGLAEGLRTYDVIAAAVDSAWTPNGALEREPPVHHQVLVSRIVARCRK